MENDGVESNDRGLCGRKAVGVRKEGGDEGDLKSFTNFEPHSLSTPSPTNSQARTNFYVFVFPFHINISPFF
ncbi:hypothetical protein L6452_28491 [Arctium lappa]|uniref:Uncharacterized protein n=1 Tax=Arctium lappa TaxID=4217 RepID=A0ACB8ZYF2_ARCLA|nr:hypothetical protein L6452_28491 [Arctium lappa]